jgi:hypothetical protein
MAIASDLPHLIIDMVRDRPSMGAAMMPPESVDGQSHASGSTEGNDRRSTIGRVRRLRW